MANEEGIKISITAEDRFTETIKRIEASTKIFGETAKNTERHLAALEKEMVRLVANGMNPADAKIKEMKANYDKLSQSINGNGGALKDANKKWMSLSLVIQDLPYGFRGIQNNLPALVGSFAAAGGAIYLAFSTAIAITTAFEKEIIQLIYGIDAFSVANKKMNDSLATSIGEAKSQIAVDESLLKIINDTTKSTVERTRALTTLKEEYKGNIELQKLDIEDGDKLAEVYNKISNALIRRAKATAYASLIAEEETKIFKLQNQQGEEVVKNLGFIGTVYGLATSGALGLNAASNIVTSAFDKQAKEIKQSELNIELYTKKLDENTEAANKNADAQSLDTTAIKDKGAAARKKAAKEAEKFALITRKRLAGVGGQIEYIAEPGVDPMAESKAFQKKLAFDKKLSKERVDYLNQQYELEVSAAEGSFEKIQAAEENMRIALNKGFMDGTIKLSEYLDAINELRKRTNKTVTDESKAALSDMMKMGIGIMNALGPALDMLLEKGASIGEVLSRAFQDIIKKLIKVAIAAAVAVALLSILFPKTVAKAGGAMKMFGNLVGGGMGLGTQLFANGGIVSGPTLGLMGEYPGARNNPEVIAPLDKLKGMMGAGMGGSLSARISGNDLLILMNKAARNNQTTF